MVAKCQKSIEINLDSSGEFYLKALHNNDSIQMNVDSDTDGIYNRLVSSTKSRWVLLSFMTETTKFLTHQLVGENIWLQHKINA